MREELKKILDLVEQGTITAAQAEELLDAMGIEKEAEKTRQTHTARFLKIHVLSSGGDQVNIKLPAAIVRSGIDLSKHFNLGTNGSRETLNDLDWSQVVTMVEDMIQEGTTGEVLTVSSAAGDKVLITLE